MLKKRPDSASNGNENIGGVLEMPEGSWRPCQPVLMDKIIWFAVNYAFVPKQIERVKRL